MYPFLLPESGSGWMPASYRMSFRKSVTSLGRHSICSMLIAALALLSFAKAQTVPVYNFENFTTSGSALYFTANTAGNEAGLWKSDGTAAGTILLKVIYATHLTAVNGILYFSANEKESGFELWKSNGTVAGTVKIKDVSLRLPVFDEYYGYSRTPIQLTATDNLLYFTANNGVLDYELWRTDGTAAGTIKVTTVYLINYEPPVSTNFVRVGNTLYFDSKFGLSKTNGTPQSTVFVKETRNFVSLLSQVNGILYFTYNGQLWKTDGISATTSLVKDFTGTSIGIVQPAVAGNTLFFSAFDYSANNYSVWKSDGTAAGTIPIKTLPGRPIEFAGSGNILYFFISNLSSGKELWKSDGTLAGTFKLKTISTYMEYLSLPTDVNGTLFFRGFNGSYSDDVWKSNGTVSGTVLVKDIYPGSNSSQVDNFIKLNSMLYFNAANFSTSSLWKSNGTPNGTVDIFATQPSINKIWDKTFGATLTDELTSTIKTNDGGFLLTGDSDSGIGADKSEASRGNLDFWAVKVSSLGIKQWDKRFGGGNLDKLTSAIATNDGGYLLAGYSKSGISGDKSEASRGETDFWAVKVSSLGIKQWDKRFGGTMAESLSKVIQTVDGGFLLAGYSSSAISGDKSEASRGNTDYWVVKINSSGTKLWDKRFGGSGYDYLTSAVQTSDGGFLLAGHSASGAGGDKTEASRGDSDFWIVKLNNTGTKQWDKTYGGTYPEGLYSAIQTSDGGYLLGGSTKSGIGGDKSEASRGYTDFWVVKTNAAGTKLWDKTLGGNFNDEFTSAIQTTDGGYLLGGDSDSGIGADKSEASRGNLDFWVVKINNSGIKQWDKRFGGTAIEGLRSIIGLGEGNYLLSGFSDSGIGGDKSEANRGSELYTRDYWMLKMQDNFAAPVTCSASGTILREVWLNIQGSLVSNIPLLTTPSATYQLASFETPSNVGNNYGQRIRGYICSPQSGLYTFYIAGDDRCELYLSSDEDPARKTKIASVPYFTGVREWNKYASQKSVPVLLEAGKRYYIEALHKEGLYSDNLSVGWIIPGQNTVSVIAGSCLSPYLPSATASIARIGVEERYAGKVSIYPNPFEDKLTLTSLQPGKSFVSLMDNLGRTVHQTTTEAETTLNLAHLKSGVYVLKISTQEGVTQMIKVVKK